MHRDVLRARRRGARRLRASRIDPPAVRDGQSRRRGRARARPAAVAHRQAHRRTAHAAAGADGRQRQSRARVSICVPRARRARSIASTMRSRSSVTRSASRRPIRAINTEWGELFLEKYNKAEAAKSFQEALKVDPEYGPALLGMAKALADENPPQAIVFAQRVAEAESERRRRAARARAGRDLPGQEGRRQSGDRSHPRVQPEASRSAVDEGGDGLRRRPRPGIPGRGRRGAEDSSRPTARSIASSAR